MAPRGRKGHSGCAYWAGRCGAGGVSKFWKMRKASACLTCRAVWVLWVVVVLHSGGGENCWQNALGAAGGRTLTCLGRCSSAKQPMALAVCNLMHLSDEEPGDRAWWTQAAAPPWGALMHGPSAGRLCGVSPRAARGRVRLSRGGCAARGEGLQELRLCRVAGVGGVHMDNVETRGSRGNSLARGRV